MIQALFAGVFLIVWMPVIFRLVATRHDIEKRLSSLGRTSRVVIAILMAFLLAGALQRDLPIPGLQYARMLSSTAGQYVLSIPLHELGHFAFAPFGETMRVLGGSLLEVLLPLLLFAFFLAARCPQLAAFLLFIAGYHCIHVALYMATAHAPDSTLLLSLDQNPETHDWWRLFTWWGLLEHDEQISTCTIAVGMFIGLASMIALFVFEGGARQNEVSSVNRPGS